MTITNITIFEENADQLKGTLIELSEAPTPEEMATLFVNETIVLCF